MFLQYWIVLFLLCNVVLAWTPVAEQVPASDDLWARCICKGAKALTQMSYSDYDVGQSLPNRQDTAQSPWSFGKFTTRQNRQSIVVFR